MENKEVSVQLCFIKKRMANDETDIIKILEFLIDNIFVMFGGRVFQHAVGIHKSANGNYL